MHVIIVVIFFCIWGKGKEKGRSPTLPPTPEAVLSTSNQQKTQKYVQLQCLLVNALASQPGDCRAGVAEPPGLPIWTRFYAVRPCGLGRPQRGVHLLWRGQWSLSQHTAGETETCRTRTHPTHTGGHLLSVLGFLGARWWGGRGWVTGSTHENCRIRESVEWSAQNGMWQAR